MADQQSQEQPNRRQPNVCWCGCGGATQSRFVPGHDAKFHSRAKKVARGLATMPESFVNDEAKADFLKHHDAEKAKVEAKASTKAGSPAPRPSGGSVVAPGGDVTVRNESASPTGLRPALLRDFPAGETLCVGIDFAWWGGGTSPRSQTDTLVFAQVSGEQAGSLHLKRVALSATYNPNAADTEPNCDPDAGLVLRAVQDVLASHGAAARVVLAVDAPLRALDRPHLPARSRKADKKASQGQKPGKALEYRQCDQVARKGLGLDRGNRCWRHVWNVQPGAPLCPRVAALVKSLRDHLGFQLYTNPSTEVGNRLLFECFPGEALWSLGTRGTFDPYRAGEAKEYKQERFRDPRLWDLPAREAWRPWPTVLSWVYQGLYGFADRGVLGVAEGVFTGWMADLTRNLLTDDLVMDSSRRRASRGKQLDDVVESVNCFFTAVSFVRNRAHAWIGDDAADGHIIGPGL
jgi:hypothetical protein